MIIYRKILLNLSDDVNVRERYEQAYTNKPNNIYTWAYTGCVTTCLKKIKTVT